MERNNLLNYSRPIISSPPAASEMVLSTLLTVIAIGALSIWLFYRHKFAYWRKRNVPTPPLRFPMGSIPGVEQHRKAGFAMQAVYTRMRQTGADFCGIYVAVVPAVLALRPQFLRLVMIEAFAHFTDRGVYTNQRDEPIGAHMATADGPHWRRLHAKISPTFTPAKVRYVFPTALRIGQQLTEQLLDQLHRAGPEVRIRDLMSRYSSDVIAACGFGIAGNSLRDPHCPVWRTMRKECETPRRSFLGLMCMIMFKEWARKLQMRTVHDDSAEFFRDMVAEMVRTREAGAIRRNDFMDLLIEIKNRGTLDGEQVDRLTLEEITSQAYVFFLAGYELLVTAMSLGLWELAWNPTIQSRSRAEIVTVMSGGTGDITYEKLLELPYTNRVISEIFRKHTPAYLAVRQCVADYPVPDTHITIEKGTFIAIPIHAIHHDPEYWPDPSRFDPDRFTPELIAGRPTLSYLPFGAGPRNCAGQLFVLMQMRIAMVAVLLNFDISPSEQTPRTVELTSSGPIHCIKDDFVLKLRELK